MSIKGGNRCECIFQILHVGEFPLLTLKCSFLESQAIFSPRCLRSYPLKCQVVYFQYFRWKFSYNEFTLYWSFKHNTINAIWSSGWLTDIKKMSFSKTILRDLLRHSRTWVSLLTGFECLWLCDSSCPLLMNSFSLLFLTGISLPSNQLSPRNVSP